VFKRTPIIWVDNLPDDPNRELGNCSRCGNLMMGPGAAKGGICDPCRQAIASAIVCSTVIMEGDHN